MDPCSTWNSLTHTGPQNTRPPNQVLSRTKVTHLHFSRHTAQKRIRTRAIDRDVTCKSTHAYNMPFTGDREKARARNACARHAKAARAALADIRVSLLVLPLLLVRLHLYSTVHTPGLLKCVRVCVHQSESRGEGKASARLILARRGKFGETLRGDKSSRISFFFPRWAGFIGGTSWKSSGVWNSFFFCF